MSTEMQCSSQTELAAYVYTLVIAQLSISNLYPAHFPNGPGVADAIRQRHNRAIKKSQRASPERKRDCWLQPKPGLIELLQLKKKKHLILLLAFWPPFRVRPDGAHRELGEPPACSSAPRADAGLERAPGRPTERVSERMSQWQARAPKLGSHPPVCVPLRPPTRSRTPVWAALCAWGRERDGARSESAVSLPARCGSPACGKGSV